MCHAHPKSTDRYREREDNEKKQQDTKKKPFWKKPLLITKKTVEQDPNDKDVQWVTLDLYNLYEDKKDKLQKFIN